MIIDATGIFESRKIVADIQRECDIKNAILIEEFKEFFEMEDLEDYEIEQALTGNVIAEGNTSNWIITRAKKDT